MEKQTIRSNLAVLVAAGAAWGLTEFAAGMGLARCAGNFTGAILTGLAFFWISFAWTLTRRVAAVMLIVGIAMLLKWLDAWLLPVPLNHGSVLNPMYAFLTLVAGFLLVTALSRRSFLSGKRGRIILGGAAALVAVALFPLVKFATGTPACLFAATAIPVAYVTSPVAMILAMITVPLGYTAAVRHTERKKILDLSGVNGLLSRLWPAAVVISAVVIITLVRVI